MISSRVFALLMTFVNVSVAESSETLRSGVVPGHVMSDLLRVNYDVI